MAKVSDVFFTEDNFFNVTRNFSFIGIIALGMTAVIITRGIDLSVGSVVGVSGMVTAMVLHAGHPGGLGIGGGAAGRAGLRLGQRRAGRLPESVVLHRHAGHVRRRPQPGAGALGEPHDLPVRPGRENVHQIGGGSVLGIANTFIVLLVLTIIFMIAFRYTTWGRWVYAIGGNEHAARLTGVPVNRVKLSVYMLSGPDVRHLAPCCWWAGRARRSTPWARATSCARSPRR